MTSETEYIIVKILFISDEGEEKIFPKEILKYCELFANQIDENFVICNPFHDISKRDFLKYIDVLIQFFEFFKIKPYIPMSKSLIFNYRNHFIENDFIYYHHLINLKLSELFHLSRIADFLNISHFSNLIHIRIASIFKKFDVSILKNLIQTDSNLVIDSDF